MTVPECIRQMEALGGRFEIIAPDQVKACLPENPPPELVSFLKANRDAVKAAILQQPDQITIEPIRERLQPDENQRAAMLAIRQLIDDGLITLTGKVKYFMRTGIVEVEYRFNEQ